MANRIGPYEIKGTLGKGGMGTVYRAIDLTLNREVALKVINSELSQNELLMKRFYNEAIAMARLNHPNIVILYNFSSEGDLHYIVMEYVHGENLDQIIKKEKALPWSMAFPITVQILNALGYAHTQGIIHRDIKPSNFIVQPNGIVKVTDFGISKVFGGEELTRAGMTLGTSYYMSPEQILGQPIGPYSDIYSFGITLYQMVTGRLPFAGNSDYEVKKGHLELPPLPPRQIDPKIPHLVEKAILKSLEKKPENRFPSAFHFLNALPKDVATSEQELHIERRLNYPISNWIKAKHKFFPSILKGDLFESWIEKYRNLSFQDKVILTGVSLLILFLFLILLFSIS